MTKSLLLTLFMACSMVMAQPQPKYVLLYIGDDGQIPGIAYPEGGVPHAHSIHARRFYTKSDALKFLNETFDPHSARHMGIGWIGEQRDWPETPEDVIGLFLTTDIGVRYSDTGKTYETEKQETKKVQVPLKEWK